MMSEQEHSGLERLKEDLTEFKGEMTRALLGITTTLNRINEAILGNEYGNGNSYKARLERLETFAEEQKAQMVKHRIYMAIAGGAGTSIVFIVEHWGTVTKIFGK